MNFKIKKEAIDFRNQHGLRDTDAINLKSLLIKLDVIAVFMSIPDKISGMAIKTKEKNFILINSDHSIGRQNFSICHELFHLYIQTDFIPHHCHAGSNFTKDHSTEWMADVFASYFLIPDNGIIQLIPENELSKDKITIETILKIENYFGNSRASLLYRLKEMSLISSNKYDDYNVNIKKTAKQYGYSTKLYEPGNQGLVIGNYGVLAKYLYDSEKISEGHYYSLLSDIGIDLLNNELNGDQD